MVEGTTTVVLLSGTTTVSVGRGCHQAKYPKIRKTMIATNTARKRRTAALLATVSFVCIGLKILQSDKTKVRKILPKQS